MNDYKLRDIPTFFDAPFCELNDLSDKTIAVAGVFCDHYGGGTPGSRIMPRQLRYSSYPNEKRNGIECTQFEVVDIGDLNVFPLEYEKNYHVLKSQSQKIIDTKSKQLIIGGDYSIIPPIFDGILEELKTKNIGFIRISRRLDLAKNKSEKNPGVTRYETTSTIIDLLECDKGKINIIGVSGIVSNEEIVKSEGIKVIPSHKIKENKIEELIVDINMWARNFDGLYISVDADVLKPLILKTTYENLYSGLDLEELKRLLISLKRIKKSFIAGDFTGFVPEIDLWGRDEIESVQEICTLIVNILGKEE